MKLPLLPTVIVKVKRQSPQSKFRGDNCNVITDSQDISNHFNNSFCKRRA